MSPKADCSGSSRVAERTAYALNIKWLTEYADWVAQIQEEHICDDLRETRSEGCISLIRERLHTFVFFLQSKEKEDYSSMVKAKGAHSCDLNRLCKGSLSPVGWSEACDVSNALISAIRLSLWSSDKSPIVMLFKNIYSVEHIAQIDNINIVLLVLNRVSLSYSIVLTKSSNQITIFLQMSFQVWADIAFNNLVAPRLDQGPDVHKTRDWILNCGHFHTRLRALLANMTIPGRNYYCWHAMGSETKLLL